MLAGPSSVRDAVGDGAGGDHRRMEGSPPSGVARYCGGGTALPRPSSVFQFTHSALYLLIRRTGMTFVAAFTLAVAACGSFVHSALCNSVCRRMSAAVCQVAALALSIAFVFCVVERP